MYFLWGKDVKLLQQFCRILIKYLNLSMGGNKFFVKKRKIFSVLEKLLVFFDVKQKRSPRTFNLNSGDIQLLIR